MKAPLIVSLLATGVLLVFLSTAASADPVKIAEYADARSGASFELFREHDGSFFCAVERANGVLTRFEVQPQDPPDLRAIARREAGPFPGTAFRNRGDRDSDGIMPWSVPGTGPDRPDRSKPVGLFLLLMLTEQGAS